MELDFETVRALSSPTRIQILSELLEDRSTTTSLSDELGKTKSTVSSHLDKLEEAGLVDREDVEGRRRVMYSSTDRARDIVKGKERKVRFSVAGSAVSGLAAAASFGLYLTGGQRYFQSTTGSGGSEMGAMSMESTAPDAAAQPGMSETLMSPELLLFAGIAFLTLSAGTLVFGAAFRKLAQ